MTIEKSIYVAVGFASIVLLVRVARPHWTQLVRDQKTGSWFGEKEAFQHNIEVQTAPSGIIVIRIEEAMVYPNAFYLGESIKKLIFQKTAPRLKHSENERKWCDTESHKTSLLVTYIFLFTVTL
jgi:MFS superfamily sulfate permease-like transporter